MTEITLISGTSFDQEVTLVDNQTPPQPIVLTLVTHIIWRVFKGNTVVLEKRYDNDVADTITITDALNGEILIPLLPADTAPEADVAGSLYNATYYGTGLPGPILGSTKKWMYYKHESRLVFSDGTQEVPGSYRGYLIIEPTDSWGAEVII